MIRVQLLLYALISLAAVILTALLTDIGIPLLILLFVGYLTVVVGLHFLVLFIGSRFIDPNDPPKKITLFNRYMFLSTISLILTAVRTRVTVSGKELLPDEPFVFISNHYSVFDPMIAILYLKKRRIAFVSKKENTMIPMAGRFMLANGVVSLDRSSARNAAETISKAADNVRTGKCSMGIYPEGGTNREPDKVLLKPFRSGSFKIALKAKAPVVITVISNTRGLHKRLFSHVKLDIIRVLTYEEYKHMKTAELSELVHSIMEERLRK